MATKRRKGHKIKANPAALAMLKRVYYNLGGEAALTNSPQLLLNAVKERWRRGGRGRNLRLNLRHVREFLESQPSYTVHRRYKKIKRRRSILTAASFSRLEADLLELGDLSSWNRGYKYVLIVIDCFSRHVWAKPLKTKSSDNVASAFEEIFQNDKEGASTKYFKIGVGAGNANERTMALYTDAGREFTGAPFQSVLRKWKIRHMIASSEEFHSPFVERVVRTIKERLFQAMTYRLSKNWIDILQKIISSYNSTIHSATKAPPKEAIKPENHLSVAENLLVKKRRVNAHKRHVNTILNAASLFEFFDEELLRPF